MAKTSKQVTQRPNRAKSPGGTPQRRSQRPASSRSRGSRESRPETPLVGRGVAPEKANRKAPGRVSEVLVDLDAAGAEASAQPEENPKPARPQPQQSKKVLE